MTPGSRISIHPRGDQTVRAQCVSDAMGLFALGSRRDQRESQRRRRAFDDLAALHAQARHTLEAFILSIHDPDLREALYRLRNAEDGVASALAAARAAALPAEDLLPHGDRRAETWLDGA